MTQSGQGNEPRVPAAPPEPPARPAPEWGAPWQPAAGRAPLPPENPPGDSEATQYLPPVGGAPMPGTPLPPRPYAAPPAPPGAGVGGTGGGIPPIPGIADSASEATQLLSPPPADAPATQYLPPVVNADEYRPAPQRTSDAEATAFLPPVSGGAGPSRPGDADATAFLPPVGGGAGPARPGDAEATAFLPPVGGGAVPAGPGDAEATAFLPPVGGPGAGAGSGPGAATPFTVMAREGERPPPAEFDTLFRAAAPTQHLPPVPPARPAAPSPMAAAPPPPPPASRAAAPAASRRPRKKPPALVITAVVAGCAVAGLGAGALLSGGDDDKSGKENTAVASPAPSEGAKDKGKDPAQPTPDGSAKPADPAEAQAKALDALLKDSNNSRDAVIKAVDSTRNCKDLDKSAADLRDAAGQRNALVGRLDQTAVDKLPGDNAELKAQLAKAWKSSAAADSHYAAWARQTDGKKGCAGGHARPSKDSVLGDRASADATTAKKKAADLWNPIAKQYGLTTHEWTQL
ncbi:hypothetical protein BLA24_27450 [Streptomyces cinnamoneus]|uniref:Uncharacterized protein n=1 Tax=Streptomyces cinnamoneus TaxID=53446 RepID=A0A2G1XC27_STRCJ|nr:hypothetical protein [Streptomyces cinnamoneus]PHQ48807.1 hypothetical protein BLA24_27450 [Streptomyces cinnamoneus]PPT14545.1 hypothetical protein CYQ11_18195 [Streptomyces cinnamoneus]